MFNNITPVVKILALICIALFGLSYISQERQWFNFLEMFGLHYPFNPKFRPWQLLTHMFMHGGISHLLFNMFGLISLGSALEKFLGGKKFLQLYFFSGLGAITLHFIVSAFTIYNITGFWFLDTNNSQLNSIQLTQIDIEEISSHFNSTMVGASGCLYGIAATFAILFPNSEMMLMFIPYPIKAKYLIPGILILDLFLGLSKFQWDPIAHYTHIGGALFGTILTLYWRKFDKYNLY